MKTVAVVFFAMNGGGGEKTQPTGTMLEDVVVDEVVDEVEEATLVEVVETVVEDCVLDVAEVTLVEVLVGPLVLRAMPTPAANTMMTMTATAAAALPIPTREVLRICRDKENLCI